MSRPPLLNRKNVRRTAIHVKDLTGEGAPVTYDDAGVLVHGVKFVSEPGLVEDHRK